MYFYAKMLMKGDGIEVNKSDAFHYFSLSAVKGNSNSMYKKGIMLYNGDGVDCNKKEAAFYFKKEPVLRTLNPWLHMEKCF